VAKTDAAAAKYELKNVTPTPCERLDQIALAAVFEKQDAVPTPNFNPSVSTSQTSCEFDRKHDLGGG
jgi:hypothetical protein